MPMTKPYVPAAVALLALMLASTLSFAAENRVVVLARQGDDTAHRLVRELATAGFDAEVQTDDGQDIASAAREADAAAAIRASLSGRTVQVWVADRVTDKVVIRTIDIAPGEEPLEPLVVLAAVELLRASLMEIHARHRPAGEVPPSAAATAFSAPPAKDQPTAPRLQVVLGPGFTFLGARTGISANVSAALGVLLAGRLFLSVSGIAPLSRHRISEPEGSAIIVPFVVGGDATFFALAPDYRIRPLFGLGAGALILRTRGEVNQRFSEPGLLSLSARETTAAGFTPWVRTGLVARMSKFVSMRFDVQAGYALRRHRLEMAGRYVASPGNPWLAMNLMVELTLW